MATRGKGDVHLSIRQVHDMQCCTSRRAASPPPSCGDVVALQSDPSDGTDWYERTASHSEHPRSCRRYLGIMYGHNLITPCNEACLEHIHKEIHWPNIHMNM